MRHAGEHPLARVLDVVDAGVERTSVRLIVRDFVTAARSTDKGFVEPPAADDVDMTAAEFENRLPDLVKIGGGKE